MGDTAMALVIVVVLIGALAGAAYLLQRRSQNKGDLLTGSRRPLHPQARGRFYLSLLGTLVGVVLGVWGILSPSIPLIVIGGLLFVASIGMRYYWQFTRLVRKDESEDQPSDST